MLCARISNGDENGREKVWVTVFGKKILRGGRRVFGVKRGQGHGGLTTPSTIRNTLEKMLVQSRENVRDCKLAKHGDD